MNIDDIIPYEGNARHNEKAIPVVAESIRTFGFKGAIVLRSREDPTIVNGHTRVAACKSLGWTEFPDENIVYADDLTDDEVKALRLADNRTGEVATWNKALLKREVRALDKSGFDMSRFKFDFKSKAEGFRYGQERVKTDQSYNLPLMHRLGTGRGSTSDWGIPRLEPVDYVPDDLIGFNYVKSYQGDRSGVGVHFFIDDYQFERCWKAPESYVDVFREHQCVVMPDYSLYLDMPMALQLYNAYRNAFCAKVWQLCGATVIPCLMWSTPESYGWCFDAIPRHSTVAVSTVGVDKDAEGRKRFAEGMEAAIRITEPSRILLYGPDMGEPFDGIDTVRYKARSFGGG